MQEVCITSAFGTGCTKKDPIVVGKPAEFMLANIAEAFGMERKQICMVGDRLDTDILFGQDGGLSTMLVLSGIPALYCMRLQHAARCALPEQTFGCGLQQDNIYVCEVLCA